ncbi:MAG: hypothetical protein QOC81_4082 [Thermoanaerobaculia bacterium]|jgi:hypothetical protein|nr:hypothetical protein [Thermoanaerobaculia bacterium]
MSRGGSKNYHHNKGEKDASKGRHDPPHQGSVFSSNWWNSDRSGRPVTDKKKRADYDSYSRGSSNTRRQKKDKGGCYLTTACVQHAGLSDDCHELRVLRDFRDSYVARLPNGAALLEEYYTSAPVILRAIEARLERDAILMAVFNTVREAVLFIEAGCHQEAFESYARTFNTLRAQYVQ